MHAAPLILSFYVFLYLQGLWKLVLPRWNDAENGCHVKICERQPRHKAFLPISHVSHRQKSCVTVIYTLKLLWCHNQLISFTASHSPQTQQTSAGTILLMRFCWYIYLDAKTVTAVRHKARLEHPTYGCWQWRALSLWLWKTYTAYSFSHKANIAMAQKQTTIQYKKILHGLFNLSQNIHWICSLVEKSLNLLKSSNKWVTGS